jgi:hypothetical protein
METILSWFLGPFCGPKMACWFCEDIRTSLIRVQLYVLNTDTNSETAQWCLMEDLCVERNAHIAALLAHSVATND